MIRNSICKSISRVIGKTNTCRIANVNSFGRIIRRSPLSANFKSLQPSPFRFPFSYSYSQFRYFSTSNEISEDELALLNSEREKMNFDVVIVGGGPSGLSAAIRLKQNALKAGIDISVCVIEKGVEIGAHILSGNVFDPKALKELIPDFAEKSAPLNTMVKTDRMFFLTSKHAIPLPVPPQLHNHGNYIISLGELTRWLASEAESLGVEIFPGFAASEVLFDSNGAVNGIATKDLGIGKDGKPKDTFARGMELRAHQTLIAEGTRGSLSEKIQEKFKLREGVDPQTYGIGLKEVWEIDPALNDQNFGLKGSVMHTVGWPGESDTWMGTFMYHLEDNKIFIGMVVGLDYPNPYLNPYQEFQRFKHHPHIAKHLKGGKCISYGARTINEGGIQSLPKLVFPGGALIGCSAGFLNVPKIKGTHTAMKSGMLAADAIFQELKKATSDVDPESKKKNSESSSDEASALSPLSSKTLSSYTELVSNSWVYDELNQVRNVHPLFKYGGFYPWSLMSAFILFISKGREPFTLHNLKHDHEKTKLAASCKPIQYPKPDGVISFDILTNLQRSGVHHEDDQKSHLQIKADKKDSPLKVSLAKYAGPEGRFCPARVYEYVEDSVQGPSLVINSQNCIHCKTCAIKTPDLFIDWNVPEGAGGPKYGSM